MSREYDTLRIQDVFSFNLVSLIIALAALIWTCDCSYSAMGGQIHNRLPINEL